MVLRWLTVIHKEKDITLDFIYFLIQGTVLIMHHFFLIVNNSLFVLDNIWYCSILVVIIIIKSGMIC
jgi:hypothetical protein